MCLPHDGRGKEDDESPDHGSGVDWKRAIPNSFLQLLLLWRRISEEGRAGPRPMRCEEYNVPASAPSQVSRPLHILSRLVRVAWGGLLLDCLASIRNGIERRC